MNSETVDFDVIVVGAGHAGCEAALASARLGARTLLITQSKDAIARMSCNPSIGGIGKSHLVFELDALGGEMALNTDLTGIQFRTLNMRKGPAVQANRAQSDAQAYSLRMRAVLENTAGLTIVEGLVTGLVRVRNTVTGVELADGSSIAGRAVVLCSGTFLNGRLFVGSRSWAGGRIDEPAANGLTETLAAAGIRTKRLKTGTPARLAKESLDYGRMKIQEGEIPVPFFSWNMRCPDTMFHVEQGGETGPVSDPGADQDSKSNGEIQTPNTPSSPSMLHVEQSTRVLSNPPSSHEPLHPWTPGSNQLPCYLTYTTEETQKIAKDNLDKSSMYGGLISGTGVRYCPSFEDKVVKFPNVDHHHVFIEPEGRDSPLVYPNGISNSFPEDIQERLIHSIPGLEKAEIVRWAYAIEYDFFDPTQLSYTLASQVLTGLYIAGQLNGTTGYEEAAAQGFVAGANAALQVLRREELIISRADAYIGVMIDDLITKGTNEPYRMFTSRAEHRLILRQDNAVYRLLNHSERLGIRSTHYIEGVRHIQAVIAKETKRLESTYSDGHSLAQILCRPHMKYADLPGAQPSLPAEAITQIEIGLKYQGYIAQENRHIEKSRDAEKIRIPPDIDYWSIKTLRKETQEKLSAVRPANLGQASRVPGISPADISILAIMIHKISRGK